MIPQKSRKLAWLILPAVLGTVTLFFLLFLLPQFTRAQSALEFTATPVEQTILPGGLASINIGITNTGNVSLTDIFVGANILPCRQSPIFDNSVFPSVPLILGPGESYSYSCVESSLNIDIDEKITIAAEATDGSGSISDFVQVVVHVTHLAATFGSEIQAVAYGDSAQLTLYLTNSGTYDLTDIAVTPRDAAFSDCQRTAGQLPNLAGGESSSFSCWSPNIFEDAEIIFDLTATVDGTTAVSEAAALFLDSNKGVALTITPDEQKIPANSTAGLTIRLSNPGSEPTTNISVSSADFPTCNRSVGSLPDLSSGESYEYVCHSIQLATDATYTMTASATTNNLAVTAVAHTTIYANSMVTIEVAPDYLIVPENEPVTLTITVTNLLTETLTNVAVSATPGSAPFVDSSNKPAGASLDCDRPLADLPPGAVVSYVCQSSALPGEPGQSFTLSGFSAGELEDSDAAYHFDSEETYLGLAKAFLPVSMNNYQRPFAAPDLTVTNLSVNKISNNTYSINLTVKNQSTLPVTNGNNFYINAYLTSNLNNPIYVCSVQGQWFGAGQSYSCSGQITLAQGSQVIRAWADPYDTVTEEFEFNNTRDLEVNNE